MRVIDFKLDPGHTTIDHPGSLRFLHTAAQDKIVSWWLEDRTKPQSLTHIYVAMTGEDLPAGYTKYLGSNQVFVQSQNTFFVYHIFQLCE